MKFLKNWWLTLFLLALFFVFPFNNTNSNVQNLTVSQFVNKVNEKEIQNILVEGDSVKSLVWNNQTNSTTTFVTQKESYQSVTDLLLNLNVSSTTISSLNIEIKQDSSWKYWFGIFGTMLPLLFFGLMLFMLMRGIKGVNSNALTFGNTRAKKIMPDDKKNLVTFKDVAGSHVAKRELSEIVEFLKSPAKFLEIGAVIPKGVLMTGAPGTGKTLLARAVAGEAQVPFFHLSGSEFVEMFVGVGASRVRDLFSEAKKSAPSIIFIDEIDSIGRSRGIGMGGGNDEREQTLNQILVEMDGFEPTEKVIVMAATNRSDVLDQALLRPGRFDRRIVIDLPDFKEREEILHVHSRMKRLENGIDFAKIAKRTPGFSGAELQSLMNEAAISAARDERKEIKELDILNSIEKVMLGPERMNHLAGEKEKKLVAYHEAGHALVASMLPNADPVHKISIISRGSAGGYTLKLPTDERRLTNKKVFEDDIAMTFGGYAAEELIEGVVSTGPSNDLEQATAMARAMVTRFGMSDAVGPISIESDRNAILYGRPQGDKVYSNETSKLIDDEIKRILEEGRQKARNIVKDNRHILEAIVDKLLKEENIEREEYEKLLQEYNIPLKK